MKIESIARENYFTPIIGDFTGFSLVKFLKSESHVVSGLKNKIIEPKKANGSKVKVFRSDNAKEFLSVIFEG